VTSLVLERLQAPSDTRDARVLESARKRMLAELAGRTVWCASGHGPGRADARRLRAHLRSAGDEGVAARRLHVPEPPHEADAIAGVQPGDIVVLHAPLTATPAEAIRQRGAHAVWQVSLPRDLAPAVDAYVVTGRTADGAYVVAAFLPSAGIMTAKQAIGATYHDFGWCSLLADVVRRDREECVGGTLHARPAIAAR
jgi:hypothetical protein